MATYKIPGHVYVSVNIGISYRDIIELYSKLIEEEIVFYESVINQQIGHLMPENNYKEWEFVENRDNTKTFEDLLNSIQIYAFKYFEEFKDFNNLFEAFENRTRPILSIHRDIYLPIMYYLKGEKEKGLQVIEEAIKRRKEPVEIADHVYEKNNIVEVPGTRRKIIREIDPEYLKFIENYKLL